jgi:TIR domain
LAPKLQAALHKFAKPWYRMRAIRVFRDDTNLSISPDLWLSIEKALGESEYFLLLASSQAAESKWVDKEVDFWLSHKTRETLLIVLTEGGALLEQRDGGFRLDRDYVPAGPAVQRVPGRAAVPRSAVGPDRGRSLAK